MAQLDSIDAEIQSRVGLSLLEDRIMLEPIVCLAIALKNFPLAKTLVERGPPAPENETKALWRWREHVALAEVITDPATTTALIRNHWLKVPDAYASQITRIADEAMAMDRIDALSVFSVTPYGYFLGTLGVLVLTTK